MELTITTSINMLDLVDRLESQEDATKLILAIDTNMADWDFTYNLAKMFVSMLDNAKDDLGEEWCDDIEKLIKELGDKE